MTSECVGGSSVNILTDTIPKSYTPRVHELCSHCALRKINKLIKKNKRKKNERNNKKKIYITSFAMHSQNIKDTHNNECLFKL